jgi:hypothetical protein
LEKAAAARRALAFAIASEELAGSGFWATL